MDTALVSVDSLVRETDVFFFENEAGQVYLIPDLSCALIEWRPGPLQSDSFREVYEAALRLMREEGLTKLLMVNRFRPPLSEEDQDWIVNDWVVRAVAIGYKFLAIVEAEDVLSRAVTTNIMTRVSKQPYRIRLFLTRIVAELWLQEMN